VGKAPTPTEEVFRPFRRILVDLGRAPMLKPIGFIGPGYSRIRWLNYRRSRGVVVLVGFLLLERKRLRVRFLRLIGQFDRLLIPGWRPVAPQEENCLKHLLQSS
jgi:hypothetical protein